jgi:hypothetical protein
MAEQDEAEGIVAPKGPATIQDRIAAFRMLDAMANATQAQRIVRLTLVGFNRNDIAAMLQTSAQSVSQVLYTERKKAQKPPRASKSKKPDGEDEQGA